VGKSGGSEGQAARWGRNSKGLERRKTGKLVSKKERRVSIVSCDSLTHSSLFWILLQMTRQQTTEGYVHVRCRKSGGDGGTAGGQGVQMVADAVMDRLLEQEEEGDEEALSGELIADLLHIIPAPASPFLVVPEGMARPAVRCWISLLFERKEDRGYGIE
jgi:hypothetical protein